MKIIYQKRCKGWHRKWVSKGYELDVTRSAAREEIARGVALPKDENSDLYPEPKQESTDEQE